MSGRASLPALPRSLLAGKGNPLPTSALALIRVEMKLGGGIKAGGSR